MVSGWKITKLQKGKELGRILTEPTYRVEGSAEGRSGDLTLPGEWWRVRNPIRADTVDGNSAKLTSQEPH